MFYQQQIEAQNQILKKLNYLKSILSFTRIALLSAAIYLFYLTMFHRNTNYAWWAILCIVMFIITVNIYLKYQNKVKYHQALLNINKNEIAFLEGTYTFDDGEEFINPQHAFSYDLDLFGRNSIFQFINRTGTYLGKNRLADDLQNIPTKEIIQERQDAIKELSNKIDFRQHFQTLANLADTSVDEDYAIKKWCECKIDKPHSLFKICAILFPVLFLIFLFATIFDFHPLSSKFAMFLFTINLLLSGLMSSSILKEIGKNDKIGNSLQQYAQMIELLENTKFQSRMLQNIQSNLHTTDKQATKVMGDLAKLFEKLNTIANLFVFIAFNGIFQYHFWVYQRLLHWKEKNQMYLWNWILVIGEVESLNSFANFAYNNQEYTYPQISKEIKFTQLGHPLLSKEKRVRNSIDFSNQSFVILTGSNMSGKSTFLRTVGINLVLSYAGAPIDAKNAIVCPLPLWVSMRLTDSLSDSESFFFAEVKRLKQIVTEAEKQPIFVLLDEILKGTNSDDKKSGTVGVIEKLHQYQVKGMIATHDLEVCQTTEKYPNSMVNKCFEVEIINDELHFDYKLKDGICQNKNATFIMQKMEII